MWEVLCSLKVHSEVSPVCRQMCVGALLMDIQREADDSVCGETRTLAYGVGASGLR